MLEPAILTIILFLLVMLVIYLWASQRNVAKTRPLTNQQYLWRLKQITGKSEYDIFQIAAEEKGWANDWVETHFKRYLEDQTIPIYVQQFIEDGKAYIEAYRPRRGNFFNKKVVLFFQPVFHTGYWWLFIFLSLYLSKDLSVELSRRQSHTQISSALYN